MGFICQITILLDRQMISIVPIDNNVYIVNTVYIVIIERRLTVKIIVSNSTGMHRGDWTI